MSATKRLRVAVVGAGFGQQVLVPVFQSLAECEVIALTASSLEKAQRVAQVCGIRGAYGDWRKMLELERPDLVAIAAPPAVQYEIAREALTAGLPLLCEKPLALTSAQSLDLVERGLGVPAMVDFEFAETPAFQRCAELVKSGVLGQLTSIDLRWTLQTYANLHGLESWKTRTCDGGGALFAFGSHTFYYLEWLFGPIASTGLRLSGARAGNDTQVLGDLTFASGLKATVCIDTNDPVDPTHTLRVSGRDGSLELRNSGKDHITGFTLSHITAAARATLVEPITGPMDGRIGAVQPLAARLVRWIREGIPSHPDLTSGHRVQQLIEAVLHSQ